MIVITIIKLGNRNSIPVDSTVVYKEEFKK